MSQDSHTHRVVLVVEVDESTDLSPADLVAMADMLREAAAELAPHGTTRASVELGLAGELSAGEMSAGQLPVGTVSGDGAAARTA